VAIAGPTLFAGYYKDEGKTAEALQDGWFATGDIGELTPAGALRIIDRRKNIFKLSQGARMHALCTPALHLCAACYIRLGSLSNLSRLQAYKRLLKGICCQLL
jgi:hypothetical protein